MITLIGEALVDLVSSRSGAVSATLGGAPFNTARTCARLGADAAFVGALSTDRFGERLAAALTADGVDISGAPRVDAPTTLAAAELDDRGAATYRFYVLGTSAPQLEAVPDPTGGGVIFTGGLGLVLEPMASVIEEVLANRAETFAMIDVNCRPPLIVDRDSYRARVERAVTDVDLVKMSDDDMTYLYPDLGPGDAVERLLRLGVGAVLMTTGGDAVTVATGTGEARVPVTPVSVVDTVGAGDTFDGALLAWLVGNGSIARGDLGLPVIERAVVAANVAAGIACTRRGADPPSAEDVGSDWWS